MKLPKPDELKLVLASARVSKIDVSTLKVQDLWKQSESVVSRLDLDGTGKAKWYTVMAWAAILRQAGLGPMSLQMTNRAASCPHQAETWERAETNYANALLTRYTKSRGTVLADASARAPAAACGAAPATAPAAAPEATPAGATAVRDPKRTREELAARLLEASKALSWEEGEGGTAPGKLEALLGELSALNQAHQRGEGRTVEYLQEETCGHALPGRPLAVLRPAAPARAAVGSGRRKQLPPHFANVERIPPRSAAQRWRDMSREEHAAWIRRNGRGFQRPKGSMSLQEFLDKKRHVRLGAGTVQRVRNVAPSQGKGSGDDVEEEESFDDKRDEDELFASDSDREDGGTHPKMKAATNSGEEEADEEISITTAQKRFIDQKLNQFRTTKKAPLRSEPPDPLQQVLCREVTPGAK